MMFSFHSHRIVSILVSKHKIILISNQFYRYEQKSDVCTCALSVHIGQKTGHALHDKVDLKNPDSQFFSKFISNDGEYVQNKIYKIEEN